MNGKTIHPMKEQRGVVLVVALLVLTVLSVLGLAFLMTARTEDTIAANYRNHTATFYAAEDYHQDYYQKNPLRYKYYRYSCGRDQRLEQLWGKKG